jgi:hypothetical protein
MPSLREKQHPVVTTVPSSRPTTVAWPAALGPSRAGRFGPRAGSLPERANLGRMASADKEALK